MQFHTLKRIHPNKKSVQVGRGGKRGKTSGRGGKGQTARAGHKIYPQLRDAIKRIPKLRGRGKHGLKGFGEKPMPVNLDTLEQVFAAGAAVDPEKLRAAGAISLHHGRIPSVKILGRGALTKVLIVSGCLVSESAKQAIIKAGGQVTEASGRAFADKAAKSE